MLYKNCKICNTTFTSFPSDNRKFCSPKCFYLSRTIHGMYKTKFYRTWQQIKDRCYSKNRIDYHNYGGRGITVCKQWLKFENFRDDMYLNYKKHKLNNNYTSIDRINNNGNYCKENCRWANVKEQCNNRRQNRLLTYKNQTLNIMQWSKKLNINHYVLYNRFHKNWSIKKILTTPVKKYQLSGLNT